MDVPLRHGREDLKSNADYIVLILLLVDVPLRQVFSQFTVNQLIECLIWGENGKKGHFLAQFIC